jgi:hypothetical protein
MRINYNTFELGATTDDRKEVYTKNASEFTGAWFKRARLQKARRTDAVLVTTSVSSSTSRTMEVLLEK